MTIRMIRIFFLMLSMVAGYHLGTMLTGLSANGGAIGAGIGFIAAAALMLLEIKLQHISLRNLSAGAFGLIFGFFMAWMITLIFKLIPMDEFVYDAVQIIFTLVFCYLGMIIAIKGKDEFNLVIPYVRFSREDRKEQLYLLDTSVIIDGRISGICETGFITGKLVVPRFVLHELQQVADSSDDAKRNRGRRGLDMLNRLKKTQNVEVIIHDESMTDVKAVDAKLIKMGKILGCSVLTNDFNLNKVAKIEGVTVLNINDLADALKPVVFPGEQMNIYVRKEGKEKNQGVAFLDDGTMIVIDNARKMIGKSVNISITSVLQTSSGRMIFAELIERPERIERPQDRPSRTDRPDRGGERNDRVEGQTPQQSRSGRNDRPLDRGGDRYDRGDNQERSQDRQQSRNDRYDRGESQDRGDGQDRHHNGTDNRGERDGSSPERPERQERSGRRDRHHRYDRRDRYDRGQERPHPQGEQKKDVTEKNEGASQPPAREMNEERPAETSAPQESIELRTEPETPADDTRKNAQNEETAPAKGNEGTETPREEAA
ncbi:MAG: hypothetical protein PHT95_00150 [Candidatus Omnitrophica bacterium]|nr:hypothetical protein [Candidatus Omnitrophota bacterium]MDD4013611.1 hypothetical protein [Candidatus Omnitrophota bacterium]